MRKRVSLDVGTLIATASLLISCFAVLLSFGSLRISQDEFQRGEPDLLVKLVDRDDLLVIEDGILMSFDFAVVNQSEAAIVLEQLTPLCVFGCERYIQFTYEPSERADSYQLPFDFIFLPSKDVLVVRMTVSWTPPEERRKEFSELAAALMQQSEQSEVVTAVGRRQLGSDEYELMTKALDQFYLSSTEGEPSVDAPSGFSLATRLPCSSDLTAYPVICPLLRVKTVNGDSFDSDYWAEGFIPAGYLR